MVQDRINVFREYETAPLDWSAGRHYEFQFHSVTPGGGLNPAALACSKVTGKTFREIFVPSTDNKDLQC